MSDPLTTCWDTFLGQTSSIKSLTYSQLREEKVSWETFRQVQLFNSNASTLYAQGTPSPYYQYRDSTEKIRYSQGSVLFAYYLGYTSSIS